MSQDTPLAFAGEVRNQNIVPSSYYCSGIALNIAENFLP